jgi:hypothetical protein
MKEFFLRPLFNVTPIGLVIIILCFLPFHRMLAWRPGKKKRELAKARRIIEERQRLESLNEEMISSLRYICRPLINSIYRKTDEYFRFVTEIDRAITTLCFTAKEPLPFFTEQFVGDMRRLFSPTEVAAVLTPKPLCDLKKVLSLVEEKERCDERLKPIADELRKIASDYESHLVIK